MARQGRESGFALAEALLALALMGVLLAAVAGAFHASLQSYDQNQNIASLTQTVRSVLRRVTRDIRAAAAVNAESGKITILPPDDGSGLTRIVYEFDHTTQTLTCTRTVNGVDSSIDLFGDDVALMSFYAMPETGKDWQDTDSTKNVTMFLEFNHKGERHRVTASAAPRRNQLY